MARPRIHEEGTTATQRVAASTAALVAAGGARKTFRLSPPAYAALKHLMSLPDAPRTETELIEQLLLAKAGDPEGNQLTERQNILFIPM